MKPRFFLFVIVAVVVAAGAFAADPQPQAQTSPASAQQMKPPVKPIEIRKVECVVAGATEFPTGLQIHNTGNAMIPKGWIVSWSIPNTARNGKYTLAADLPVNGYVMASNQLPGGHPAGAVATCTVAAPLTPVVQATAVKKPILTVMPKFDCVVQGTPVEFPDDIVITNKGTGTIAKGKVLHWEIPNSGRLGDYTLTEDLLAGKSVFVSGVVGGGFPAGAQCKVTLK